MKEETVTSFPTDVRRILADYQRNGVSARDCAACSSACCSQGGFAILENVLQIYDAYRQGCLKREDYDFPQGLSFVDFIGKYFDLAVRTVGRWIWRREVLLFHMRSLSEENWIIAVPRVGYYYETRSEMFKANPWLNKGCVFLSKKVPDWPEDDKDTSRRCILHTSDSGTHITAKPIDCVFYTCLKPIEAKVPTVKESRRWFSALARMSPKSLERYRELVEKEKAANKVSDVTSEPAPGAASSAHQD